MTNRSLWRRSTVLLIVLILTFALPTIAFAHPLGNFTVNQFVGLNVRRDGIMLEYIVDMAEIPAFQEISTFDANGNGQADSSEAAAYHAEKCASLRVDLALALDGQAVDLALASSATEFPAGAGGLPTLRLTCEFRAVLDAFPETAHLSFQNHAFPERLGWREIVVTAQDVSLDGDFAIASVSNRLTNYPQDLLSNPLSQRAVEFDVVPLRASTPATGPGNTGPISSPLSSRNDEFTRLILLDEINLPTLLLALVVSFVWGVMHAMTPGHGKTIVGAYLVGSRGTPNHALYLGLTTTITHTLGVFVFGLVTLFAARYVVPEKLYPWMSFVSGLFVLGIGANLLISRYKSSGLTNPLQSIRKQLAVAGKPSLLIQPIHADGHSRHGYLLEHTHGHDHPHDHSHAHDHDHSHAHGADHSHLPPGTDGTPVTWRSLLLLGVSGGLLPCPSALVVLLGAIALNRIGLGLILVLAFSLGLAGALTAIGLLFIYAGRAFEKLPARGKLLRALPVLSALFVLLIGLAISVRALQDVGVVN